MRSILLDPDFLLLSSLDNLLRPLNVALKVSEVLFTFEKNIFFHLFFRLNNFCWPIFKVSTSFLYHFHSAIILAHWVLFHILYFSDLEFLFGFFLHLFLLKFSIMFIMIMYSFKSLGSYSSSWEWATFSYFLVWWVILFLS